MFKLLSVIFIVSGASFALPFFKFTQDELGDLKYPSKGFFETVMEPPKNSMEIPKDLKNLSYPRDNLVERLFSQFAGIFTGLLGPILASLSGAGSNSPSNVVYDNVDFEDEAVNAAVEKGDNVFSVAATPPSATANSVKEVTIAQRFDNSEDLVTTDAVNEAATKITDESQSDLTTIVPSTEKDEFDLTNEIP